MENSNGKEIVVGDMVTDGNGHICQVTEIFNRFRDIRQKRNGDRDEYFRTSIFAFEERLKSQKWLRCRDEWGLQDMMLPSERVTYLRRAEEGEIWPRKQ
jgi:hypothetical protein